MMLVSKLGQPWSSRRLAVEVKRVLDEVPSDFGGGCPLQKAILMAELIRTFEMKLTVDIGVYRGRSLFPQALAHRECSGGIAIGIDPWSAAYAKQCDNDSIQAELDSWIQKTDFEGLYHDVCAHLIKFNLTAHCRLVRNSSADALALFEQENIFCDMVHIDGNHDTQPVMADLANYLPRLASRGILILDDTSWSSVKPAFDLAASKLDLIIHDQERDYAVLSKSRSLLEKMHRVTQVRRLHRQAISAAACPDKPSLAVVRRFA